MRSRSALDMTVANSRNRAALRALGTVMAFAVTSAHGAVLSVSVLDGGDQPVADAVVTVTAIGSTPPQATSTTPAVMDQLDLAFVPGVLVIRTGAAVVFPNSDTVAHQVYSFSPAKRFELGLYRGHPHQPVLFDHPGVVVLGCNIHDNMVGYIFVTDAQYFGKSDHNGVWRGEVASAAQYEVAVWSARLSGRMEAMHTRVDVHEAPLALELHLPGPLRAAVTQERNTRVRSY